MFDQTFVVNLILYLVGTGTLLHSYMAFSPMTRDLVAFLSRDAQIGIFKHRKVYWTIGITCLGLLLLRAVSRVAGFDTVLGNASWGWLVVGGATACIIGLLFWALYVPVVMAPPVTHHLVSADEADTILKSDSVILGIEKDGEVRAYPRELIARPHWFNDELGGKPLMISYCILCNSGQAFVPVLKDGSRLDLRNMTAFDNNTIYHCNRTGNFIQQLEARVISGPNEGEVLEAYPVVMARWDEWKRLHPGTRMYYAPPVTLRDRFVQKILMTMLPLSRLAARSEPWHVVRSEIDERLPAMSFVLGVEIAGDRCAYPVSALQKNAVVNDEVGSTKIVVLYDAAHDIGSAFLARVGARDLTFEKVPDTPGDGFFARDRETGTTWTVTGHACEGELAGEKLRFAPHWNQLFWFSWAAFKPGTRIYQTGDDGVRKSEAA